ncbi:unnamed protein product [Diatraea saccharalis]|uniref:Phosphatidylinositol N-acetylglucosaminyltransferase subunit Q n=1 Tax=Diatraea saccharalis TaxID=40085 RepID=A0A9N9WB56_9NEOP|nr:unnamed protein product [Diatraea saccharalis]
MAPVIRILLPRLVQPCEEFFFGGYVYYSDLEIIIYFTNFSTEKTQFERKRCEIDNVVYGCYDKRRHYLNKKVLKRYNNIVIIDHNIEPKIKDVYLNGKQVDLADCIVILYDYEKIVNSEVKWEFDDMFSKLQSLIQNQDDQSNIMCSEPLIMCPSWLASSMFIQHIINYINIIHWAVMSVKRNRKISIKHGNLLLSILMDIFLGYLALHYLAQYKNELSTILMGMLEKLINMLYFLLKWLMGAPAGLKLNNAFNKMLGKYFSYHVQLWWLFLDVSGEKFDHILHLYYYLGYLGFTFQAAVISDMISVATFHSYCIYVYAARMFNIQVSGLIALMRFFVGRKYNPLRGSIDSCEYSNQELFVGTVAFTILLLLLPTTTMYYIVFTLFRMLSLLVQYALAKLIYILQTLPLYVVSLWLLRSPKVAGNILLEVIDSKKGSPLSIRLILFNKSIFYLVNNFCPPVEKPKKLEWASILSNILRGKQIL